VRVRSIHAAARNISLDDIRSVVAKANVCASRTLQGKEQAVTWSQRRNAARRRLPRRSGGLSQRRTDQANEVARVIDSVENDKIPPGS
jgi:HAE1 family hydrophobic/amphiphilic exporter-1